MNANDPKKEDLSRFRTLGIPLLVLMGLIALAGIVLTVVFNYFF